MEKTIYELDTDGYAELDTFDAWLPIEYTEFELWRETHKVHKDPGGLVPRCPRCFSTKVSKRTNIFGDELLYCQGCRFSELLIDFPVSGVR